MNNRTITSRVFITGFVALILFVLASCTTPEENPEKKITDPQNGIPLVILRIDESDEGIAAASVADEDHVYGTIEDMNDSEDHSVRCVGTVEIKVPDGYVGEYGSISVPEGEVELEYIRGRGNTTWMLSKKPYRIQFNEKTDLFGMGESKEWALMANKTDSSLLRNRITYWLGTQLGLNYTPQLVPVDLVMIGSKNGEKYLGSYYISETVDVESSRLNIPKLGKEDTSSTTDITGGYLLSIYSYIQNLDVPVSNWFTTPKGHIRLINETPSFDSKKLSEGRTEQRDYIRDYVNQIDELIMTDEEVIDEERHNKIAELIDLDSVADYWWLQEFSYNNDGFVTDSTFMYKEPNGKLYFGPLWDFDMGYRSWGDDVDGVLIGLNNIGIIWVDELRAKDPLFCELLKDHWKVFNDKLTELVSDGGVIDKYDDETRSSWNRNNDIWNRDMQEDTEEDLFGVKIQELKDWISSRQKWINENIEDKIDKVYFTITYQENGEVIETVSLRDGTELTAGPEMPKREGYVFLGWVNEEDGSLHSGTEVKEDMVFVPKYEKEENMPVPEMIYFANQEAWVNLTDEVYFLGAVRITPEDAEEAALEYVRWTSSDESIATVGYDGDVKLHTVGDVTITMTLYNGVSKSYILHIYNPYETETVYPESLTLQPEKIELKVGQQEQIIYSLETNGNPYGDSYAKFVSSDPEVATVDRTGLVTAVKPGTATITFTIEFYGVDGDPMTATCEVVVSE